MKEVFLTKSDIEKIIFEHICKGDTSDGIPNIRSEDNVFLDSSKRQAPMTNKRIDLLYENNDNMTEIEKVYFDRNKKLIQLKYIPKEIKRKILYKYKQLKKKDKTKIFDYILKYKLKNLHEHIRQF